LAHRGRKNVDEAVILSLAAGVTVVVAAERVGVSARTIHRRLADENFRRRITEARAAMLDATVARLTDLGEQASDVVRQLLACDDNKLRLAAAKIVFQFTLGFAGVARQLEALKLELERRHAGPNGQILTANEPVDHDRNAAILEILSKCGAIKGIREPGPEDAVPLNGEG
jgi:hypothetical protein